MNKAIIAAVIIVAVIAVGFSAFLVLRGTGSQSSASLPKLLMTQDGRKMLGAAKQETEAISMAKAQFCTDRPDKPESDVSVGVEPYDNGADEYWVATASCEDVSETYWVPQEEEKPNRMAVGQSLTYQISGSYQVMGQSGSITGAISYSVPEKVTYQGVQCFKMTLSYNVTIMGVSTNMSGYMYVDEDYRPRYANMTMGTVMGEIQMTMDYNYETGKLTITYDGTSTQTDIPDDALNQQYLNTFLGEDLYIGWSKEFSYVYENNSYIIRCTVENEELVTVPAGTFRCYEIAASMEQMENVQISMTVYTNAQMTLMPKMTMDMQMTALGQTASISMTMELESYSGL